MADGSDRNPESFAVRPLRFIAFFSLMMAAGYRRDILSTLGLADAGVPKWVIAVLLAFGLTATILFWSPNTMPRAFASQARAVRMAYLASFLIVGTFGLSVVYARVPISSPLVWAAALLV